MKCGGALWGWECTHTHTYTPTQKNPTPALPASPLATAAVLQEAALPLADQILSVTFPLINGHLLPPFSLHGYTLSLCSSHHLIVMTFNLIRGSPPRSPPVLAGLAARASRPPTCHIPAGETQGQANKQTNQAVYSSGRQTSRFRLFLQWLLFLPNFLWNSLMFQKKIFHKANSETQSLTTFSSTWLL